MTDQLKFWLFRFAVSVYGSWQFKRFGAYGFCDECLDRDGYESYTVRDYFWEAWGRD